MRTDETIRERLRKSLPTIRVFAGWSADRLAQLLDVSRATIVNIENTPGKMSIIQYLAIRALLESEIEDGNKTLGTIMELLVDKDDVLEQYRDDIRNQVARISKSTARKLGIVSLQKEVLPLFEGLKLSEVPSDIVKRGYDFVHENRKTHH